MKNRREIITLLGGAATAWPLAARAQQAAMPVVGFLRSASLTDAAPLVTGFRQGLQEAGFVEGQNVAIEFRSAEGRDERVAALAADLLRQGVAVIVANNIAALVAKSATTSVPIVFVTGSDPIRDGLVASLNRPGGNVTGVSFLSAAVFAKRLELLRQVMPGAAAFGLLLNPNAAQAQLERNEAQAVARAVGLEVIALDVDSDREVEAAFATFVQRGARALLVGSGAFFFSHREKVAALAARHELATSYSTRDGAIAGCLMSYGPGITNAYHQAGIYVGRILKGAQPADLPVEQAVKFELVINLKTAKALGLTVPDKLLALADEVIE
jgi:ABC-type uncharacterized transport system substrate-binding protein